MFNFIKVHDFIVVSNLQGKKDDSSCTAELTEDLINAFIPHRGREREMKWFFCLTRVLPFTFYCLHVGDRETLETQPGHKSEDVQNRQQLTLHVCVCVS